ncbi:MAG: DNA repair protein RecN, partial [Firmicutes bacterium]|nr:DNA repair protein RecN [Bacillota bacterium]
EALAELVQAMEMPHAQFVFQREDSLGRDGVDAVTLLFSANPGQPLQAVAKAASGGELARIALAMAVLETGDYPTTWVFDEVDAGLGGRSARKVGELLKKLSHIRQVIAISHQPTVAAQGDAQWAVRKIAEDQQTRSELEALLDHGRAQEIARMLSGYPDEEAHGLAQRLLSESALKKAGTHNA